MEEGVGSLLWWESIKLGKEEKQNSFKLKKKIIHSVFLNGREKVAEAKNQKTQGFVMNMLDKINLQKAVWRMMNSGRVLAGVIALKNDNLNYFGFQATLGQHFVYTNS